MHALNANNFKVQEHELEKIIKKYDESTTNKEALRAIKSSKIIKPKKNFKVSDTQKSLAKIRMQKLASVLGYDYNDAQNNVGFTRYFPLICSWIIHKKWVRHYNKKNISTVSK